MKRQPATAPASGATAAATKRRRAPIEQPPEAPPGPPEACGAAPGQAATVWWLYLLECRNGSYYAGIAKDVARRYAAHLAGRGARYTRANPPLRLLASRAYPDRASASRAEWQLKQLPRERKLAWLLDSDSRADAERRPHTAGRRGAKLPARQV